MQAPKIACIGEFMIELSQVDLVCGSAHVGFAGDTFNTAVYLSPLGRDVSYVTNLGQDAFSNRMLAILKSEGVGSTLMGRHDTRLPSIYSIESDAQGERSFRCWRDNSAARTPFSGVGASLADLLEFDAVYLSGITLAILPPGIRAALIDTVRQCKAAGKQVVFDTNHRPRLWPDAATARESFAAIWAATTIALPSFDDEERLYPGQSPDQVLERIAALGPTEVALKNGARGQLIRADRKTVRTTLPLAARVVDTSGAGDSFNAGYLAARLQGLPALQAAEAGHRLATAVIGHNGAVIPRAAMPA